MVVSHNYLSYLHQCRDSSIESPTSVISTILSNETGVVLTYLEWTRPWFGDDQSSYCNIYFLLHWLHCGCPKYCNQLSKQQWFNELRNENQIGIYKPYMCIHQQRQKVLCKYHRLLPDLIFIVYLNRQCQ